MKAAEGHLSRALGVTLHAVDRTGQRCSRGPLAAGARKPGRIAELRDEIAQTKARAE
jgi:hypothetical protein